MQHPSLIYLYYVLIPLWSFTLIPSLNPLLAFDPLDFNRTFEGNV
jgi:hypothetical protein